MHIRSQVAMSPEEIDTFLHGRHVINVATIDATGRPHLVAMWYGFVAGAPAFTTYERSQKVINLKRDPRITALVEDGDSYDQLRGVELVAAGEIIHDPDVRLAVALDTYQRYQAEQLGPMTEQFRANLDHTLRKRVVVRLVVERVVSWDHRKLASAS
jgi:PPOX class probable F420-dependent enzyme